MTLPSKIPVLANSSIASYSFDEVRDGFGYITFYASNDKNGPWLSTQSNRSTAKEHIYDITYADPNQVLLLSGSHTVHFSGSSFVLPRTITGTATVESYWKANRPDGSGEGSIDMEFAITKNAVDIGSFSGSQLAPADTNFVSGSVFYNIPLTETHFARGDIVGLRMTQWGKNTTGPPLHVKSYIGIDPLDRDGTVIKPSTDADSTTILKVTVPVRIDIQ